MRVKILREAGYDEVLLGLSLSFNRSVEGMPQVAQRLCDKDDGHNKFLESIVVWLDITAPRYWWQQEATYRIGITRQSESTMHTILRKELTAQDFINSIPVQTLDRLNKLIKDELFEQLKNELPEGFLQRRIICTNYKGIQIFF